MEKVGWVDVAILPLKWLERSRGWKRRGLAFLYLVVVSTVGLLAWRELSLWRLPNLREPFDEVKYGTVAVADSDNSMLLYQAAGARLKPADIKTYNVSPKAWNVTDWAVVDPVIRRWVDDNRSAMGPWLAATERSDAFLVQPEDFQINTIIGPARSIQEMDRLAILEGSRIEMAGDVEGAWRIYRGVLRSSRHAGMHGGAMQRLIGNAILMRSRARVLGWIENPAVTPAMLRRAIADVEACRAMTAPASDMVRVEYFACRDALNHPELWRQYGLEGNSGEVAWYSHVSYVPEVLHFIHREPERSHRVHRLITAGMLAQCDRPRAVRPRLFSGKHTIYDIDARTPAAVARISPEDLTSWADRSAFAMISFGIGMVLARVDSEPATFDEFRLKMAERAYQIDRGKPPRIYGDLLGPYLKALPEGLEPGDPMTADPE